MVNCEIVTEVQDSYPWASWAIWSDTFPEDGCVEEIPSKIADFFLERYGKLTPEVILLGLNRSNDFDAPFQNFHAATKMHYDYRLKRFIQDGGLDRLHGSYMTDLVDDANPDSSQVEMSEADAEVFLEQLDLLDRNEYDVICFGNKPFQGLTDYFDVDAVQKPHEIKNATFTADGKTLRLYRVWFYGLYGVHQDKVDTLEKQLEFLDNRIATSA